MKQSKNFESSWGIEPQTFGSYLFNLKGESGSVSQMKQDPFFFRFKVPPKFKASHGDISILAVYWKGVIMDQIKLAA